MTSSYCHIPIRYPSQTYIDTILNIFDLGHPDHSELLHLQPSSRTSTSPTTSWVQDSRLSELPSKSDIQAHCDGGHQVLHHLRHLHSRHLHHVQLRLRHSHLHHDVPAERHKSKHICKIMMNIFFILSSFDNILEKNIIVNILFKIGVENDIKSKIVRLQGAHRAHCLRALHQAGEYRQQQQQEQHQQKQGEQHRMKRKGSQQQGDQHRTQEESKNESQHQTRQWRVQKKHLNIKRQHSSTGAHINENKRSQQQSDIKENESHRRSDISDYQEESPHQSDIKEVIVSKIDQHQKVFNVTSGDSRVVNLVTTYKVQLKMHIDDSIDHLLSDKSLANSEASASRSRVCKTISPQRPTLHQRIK